MALKIELDTLDEVPSHFHELYSEVDGKFTLTGIEGLKTQKDINNLTTALTKERADHKQTKERYQPILSLGKEIPDIISMIDRIPELEALASGKVDETKIEQLVESRIKAKLSPVERALEAERQRAMLLENENNNFKHEKKITTIHSALRKAAKETKVRSDALDDAVMLAERYFELDETGAVIGRSDSNGVIPGMDPVAWFMENQSKRAYLWGETVGGGASGSGNNFAGIANPWSYDNWNLTEQGKILKANASRADQLAKAAGTSIGGGRPSKK